MENNKRRDFLKKSLLGITGAAILPSTLKAGVATSKLPAPSLPTRILGKTGIKTPLISMGTSGATNPGFIRTGYESGIRLFFSATYYGQGNNEKLVGEGLKAFPRDSYVIGTAASPDGFDQKSGTFTKEFTAESYIKKAEESLKRFETDYVDFILLPFSGKREMVMYDEMLKAMEQIKKQGKARFVGIASHDNIEEALKAAADAKIYDMAMPAYNFKSASNPALADAIAYAAKAGVGIVAMKTTAGAFRSKTGPALNSDAALKWVLNNENVSSIVSGMSSVEEMQKNLAMIQNLKMTDQEKKDLNLAALSDEHGLYCLQCKDCLGDCPHDLDIPAMMRAYMYAYGFKNMEHAWHTVVSASIGELPCSDCGSCSVNCRSGFNVKEKLMDIARIKDVPRDFLIS